MGKALYRTYRSKSFSEVVGQDHIITALQNSLNNDTLAHAYLLTGPRGVGKTSVARLLAHAVNKLEYSDDVTHIDIIEIDAASNRRIEEIRSLRDKVHIAPVSSRYKVYIIDEVHMLTKEAFNALLKTLEEPPSHVLFILATTEFHKVPETIVSRCIRFTFKPIPLPILVDHLRAIADKEKININDPALELLAEHAGGSFRDAISMLDQIKNNSALISKETVEQMLGLAPDSYIDEILSAVTNSNVNEIYNLIEQIRDFGVSEAKLSSQLQGRLRELLASDTITISNDTLLRLIADLIEVPASPSPGSKLELALITASLHNDSTNGHTHPQKDSDTQSYSTEPAISEITSNANNDDQMESSKALNDNDIEKSDSVRIHLEPVSDSDIPLWDAVLSSLKSQHNTLYGVARMATANHIDNTLTLCFKFPFHYKKIDDAKSKSLIAKVLNDLGHPETNLKLELDKQAPTHVPSPSEKTTKKTEDLTTITNIFGSPEMLES